MNVHPSFTRADASPCERSAVQIKTLCVLGMVAGAEDVGAEEKAGDKLKQETKRRWLVGVSTMVLCPQRWSV